MNIIFSPYFLDKYRPDFHSIERAGWIDNFYTGSDLSTNTVISALNKKIADFVQNQINKNELPLAIGGDCHKTLGVIKGIKESGLNPALLWLDAHGDFNTYKTSPSGFIGGMSLAILTGHEEPVLLNDLELEPYPEEKIILYDCRSLDKEESVSLSNSRIRQPSNLEELIDECMNEKQIYLHLDTDVINPLDAPAMLYQAPGGPRLSELKTLLKAVREKIVAVSVNIWEPQLDKNKETENAVFELLEILNMSNSL
ncbi:MAG TPA: arginase family protein [Ignavibacteriaceae bacterium]|nr:arginase family protein [Ignavibacteriaceae bacterium]